MRFYLCSARVEEVERAAGFGFVEGVVATRPDVRRTGRDYADLVAGFCELPFRVVTVEADPADAESLVDFSRRMGGGRLDRLALCTPITLESLKAVAKLRSIGVAAALQFVASSLQSLVAARAGAHAVICPARRFAAFGLDVVAWVRESKAILSAAGLDTAIWVDELEDAVALARVAAAGADGALCRWETLLGLAYHPFADRGIELLLETGEPEV